jgi:sulfite exporter TauE/SafE
MNPDTWQLVPVFLSGLAGSVHCLGMCGGIAATMSLGTRGPGAAVLRQLAWSTGRLITYAFLGLLVASVGRKLMLAQGQAVWMQSLFAVCAGLLLVLQGLRAVGWQPWTTWFFRKSLGRGLNRGMGVMSGNHPCVARTMFSQFFTGGSVIAALVAGVMTGFLPCGLVYGFLALAAGTGHPITGAMVMMCFGLGTFPMLLLTGIGLSFATQRVRRDLLRLAAISVVVTGLMTFARGAVLLTRGPDTADASTCALCIPGTATVPDAPRPAMPVVP